MVIRAGIHKKLARTANKEDHDHRLLLIWVCAVCLSLFGKQLLFEIQTIYCMAQATSALLS